VLAEVQRLARRFVEIVLTGVHLGGWGEDLLPRVDLAWLLEALAEQASVPRLRLSSIDPHEVTATLVRRMATTPALCPHLHVPLQAADDGVLHRMRRRYDVALARERLAMIRRDLPDAAIGTDLIAGFPGEDAAAFERTCAFVEESPLTYLHVFPYSVRSGTTAAKLDGHLPRPVIAARARRLRAIGERKHTAFVRRFAGTTAEVLVETTRDSRTGLLRGYTRNYLRVRLDGPDEWAGRLIAARLELAADGRLQGVPVGV
jgi:threonylcarbamoyladenosine tRNA methylthiotransferase MtaB